jgi:uncharacterized membrane protein
MRKFSLEEALRFGWETLKKYPAFLVGVVLFLALINYAPILIETYAREKVGDYLIPFRIVFTIFQVILNMGVLRITLLYVDGEQAEPRDLFACAHLFFTYFAASLVFVLFVFLGLLLFIIPGVVLALKFQFYDYFIIDKKAGIMESIEKSGKLTEGVLMDLFLFALALFGINLLGFLFVGIGLLVTMPISMVARAHVYRQLESKLQSQAGGRSM